MRPEEVVVRRFNDAINARDVGELEELMAVDHALIDTAGNRIEGRGACLEAWRSIFAAFSDYRNRIDRVDAAGEAVAMFSAERLRRSKLMARWRAQRRLPSSTRVMRRSRS